MKKLDPALTFSNPRLLASIYFGLLSVVGTILIDALLTSLGIKEIIPLFAAIILGMVVASATGALFGKSIIHCPKPYKAKTFWTGFFMVIASLPVFDLGVVLFLDKSNSYIFSLTKFHDLIYLYFAVLAYSYIIFGFLLAIGAGFAAMYLRGRLVYDILHTDKRVSQRLPNFVVARNKNKIPVQKAHTSQRKKPDTPI